MGRQNGAAIRAFRKKERMTVAGLAGHAGIAEQSLRNIENGHRPASDETIWRLARLLAVPVEAITRSGTAEGISAEIPEGAPGPDEPETAAPEAA